MSLKEKERNMVLGIGIFAVFALGFLGVGVMYYEAGRQDFKNTFHHEPALALAFDNGMLEIGFVTPHRNFKRFSGLIKTCGRSEIVTQVVGPDQHFTSEIDSAATVYSIGLCNQGFEWYVGPGYILTPPTR